MCTCVNECWDVYCVPPVKTTVMLKNLLVKLVNCTGVSSTVSAMLVFVVPFHAEYGNIFALIAIKRQIGF